MSQKARRVIHILYGIVLTLLLIALGVCMILYCIAIYQSGDSPFTRELIGACFAVIEIPVWAGIALVVVGFALKVFLPVEPAKVTARRSPATVLRKTASAYDLRTAPYHMQEKMFLLRRRRKRIVIWTVVLSVLAAIPSVVWCVMPEHFGGSDKTAEVLLASLVVLGSTAIGMGICLVSTLMRDKAYRRETDVVVAMIAERSIKRTTGRKRLHYCDLRLPFSIRFRFIWPTFWIRWGVRGVILAVALVFIILGIVNGGMTDVLGKAVNICTECIGLG